MSDFFLDHSKENQRLESEKRDLINSILDGNDFPHVDGSGDNLEALSRKVRLTKLLCYVVGYCEAKKIKNPFHDIVVVYDHKGILSVHSINKVPDKVKEAFMEGWCSQVCCESDAVEFVSSF